MRGTLQKLIVAVQAGDFPIEKLITYYDFVDVNKAIEDSVKGTSIKGVLKMPE